MKGGRSDLITQTQRRAGQAHIRDPVLHGLQQTTWRIDDGVPSNEIGGLGLQGCRSPYALPAGIVSSLVLSEMTIRCSLIPRWFSAVHTAQEKQVHRSSIQDWDARRANRGQYIGH